MVAHGRAKYLALCLHVRENSYILKPYILPLNYGKDNGEVTVSYCSEKWDTVTQWFGTKNPPPGLMSLFYRTEVPKGGNLFKFIYPCWALTL